MTKHVPGSSHLCPALKAFLSDKVIGPLSHCSSPVKYKSLDQKLEKKMIEVIKHKTAARQQSFKSMNSIIMRFPRYKDGLRNIKNVFEQYDEDSNGTIDRKELKKCLSKLQMHLPEKEIDGLYHYCDIDGNEGIQYNEFVVLLCLVYLLNEPTSASNSVSRMGSPQLEATFDTLVEAFLFLDKNGDGKLNKKEMVLALNGASPREKSPTHITANRFREMDRNKDGHISFMEFLFAFTKWVGFDIDDERDFQEQI